MSIGWEPLFLKRCQRQRAMARRTRPARDRRTTRFLQIGFLVLLVISFAQVSRWILDQVSYANARNAMLNGHFDREVRAARALLDKGGGVGEVLALFPHITITGRPPVVQVKPEAVEKELRKKNRLIGRACLEGVFFLLVLAVGMVILYGAIRQDAVLRRRQQTFLAAVSHEFKSPLASLMLSVETLSLRDPEPDARHRILGRMVTDLNRLNAMVSNILDTTRLEEGRVTLQVKRVFLVDVVRSVTESMQDRAEQEGVAVTTDVPGDLAVDADPTAVRSVLWNLLDNALSATAGKGGTTVRISARRMEKSVQLVVADDGKGFPPEEGRNLFQKFYRVGDAVQHATQGSGLGLYIVHRLVALGRGRVAAHSEGPGKGAEFAVSWPAAKEGES